MGRGLSCKTMRILLRSAHGLSRRDRRKAVKVLRLWSHYEWDGAAAKANLEVVHACRIAARTRGSAASTPRAEGTGPDQESVDSRLTREGLRSRLRGSGPWRRRRESTD